MMSPMRINAKMVRRAYVLPSVGMKNFGYQNAITEDKVSLKNGRIDANGVQKN